MGKYIKVIVEEFIPPSVSDVKTSIQGKRNDYHRRLCCFRNMLIKYDGNGSCE